MFVPRVSDSWFESNMFCFKDAPIAKKHSCPILSCLQYIRTCVQAKESPHLTLVHNSTVKALFDKELSTIGAVVSRKSSNPPLPLPPKRRVPTVSPASRMLLFSGQTCRSTDLWRDRVVVSWDIALFILKKVPQTIGNDTHTHRNIYPWSNIRCEA